MSARDWLIVIPELILLVTAVAVMFIDAFARNRWGRFMPWKALSGVVLAMIAEGFLWNYRYVGFNGMLVNDNFAVIVNFAVLIGTGLSILMSVDYARREELPQGEYYALMLLSSLGMLLMTASANLIMVFLSLEVLSIALYVLTGIAGARRKSQEAGMKYFLLGSFSSAFFVYGAALIYGAAGTIDLRAIASAPPNTLLAAGAALVIVGLGFKVAVVPFQMWTPDVYEGAPSPITAYMSIGSKAAAFAALTRVLTVGFAGIEPVWVAAIWVIAVLTMIVGNVVAISQDSIKRMLAYSSIAHAGYIMVAIAAANDLGRQAIPFYLMTYAFMNLGAWAVVTAVTRKGEEATGLADYSGLFWSHPVLATAMALFMFALAGLPPTAGFTAKIFIFAAAYQAGMIGLVIIAVLTTIVSAYFYLRVTVMMFMHRPKDPPEVRVPVPTTIAIAIAGIATIWLLVFPETSGAFVASVARLLP